MSDPGEDPSECLAATDAQGTSAETAAEKAAKKYNGYRDQVYDLHLSRLRQALHVRTWLSYGALAILCVLVIAALTVSALILLGKVDVDVELVGIIMGTLVVQSVGVVLAVARSVFPEGSKDFELPDPPDSAVARRPNKKR